MQNPSLADAGHSTAMPPASRTSSAWLGQVGVGISTSSPSSMSDWSALKDTVLAPVETITSSGWIVSPCTFDKSAAAAARSSAFHSPRCNGLRLARSPHRLPPAHAQGRKVRFTERKTYDVAPRRHELLSRAETSSVIDGTRASTRREMRMSSLPLKAKPKTATPTTGASAGPPTVQAAPAESPTAPSKSRRHQTARLP